MQRKATLEATYRVPGDWLGLDRQLRADMIANALEVLAAMVRAGTVSYGANRDRNGNTATVTVTYVPKS